MGQIGIRGLAKLAPLVALAALAACTPEATPSPPAAGSPGAAAEGEAVTVTLREWAVEPSQTEMGAGEVTFEVSNAGDLPHNFVVFRTDLAADELPVEDAQVVETDAVEEAGRIDEFDPGSTESVTLELDAGSYVLVCNLPGHYEQGMRAAFSVSD
jgi:uncharacterized cupredoxin-like copper-binding protein